MKKEAQHFLKNVENAAQCLRVGKRSKTLLSATFNAASVLATFTGKALAWNKINVSKNVSNRIRLCKGKIVPAICEGLQTSNCPLRRMAGIAKHFN